MIEPKDEAHRISKICQTVPAIPLDPRRLASRLMSEGIRQLGVAHRLEGATLENDPPILFFRLHRSDVVHRLRTGYVTFLVHSYGGMFGGTLILTALLADGKFAGRVSMSCEESTFSAIKNGHYWAVFIDGRTPFCAFDVDFRANTMALGHFSEAWNHANSARALLHTSAGKYWTDLVADTVLYEELLPKGERFLSEREELQTGWACCYSGHLNALTKCLAESLRENKFDDFLQTDVSEDIARLVSVIRESSSNPSLILNNLSTLHAQSENDLLDLAVDCITLDRNATESGQGGYLIAALGMAWDTYLLSPPLTDEGLALPWIDRTTWKIRKLPLLPEHFPAGFRRAEYWNRAYNGLQGDLGKILTGRDVPADFTQESPLWFKLPPAENIDECNAAVAAMLEEAAALKKWTIPPSAIVQMNVGPFSHFELFEWEGDVHIVCRTEHDEFAVATVRPSCQFCEFYPIHRLVYGTEPRRRIESGLRLLLTAIVRDFWVLEERETAFEEKSRSTTLSSRPRNDPRVIYLPRIRYVASANVHRCATELAHTERQAHTVRAHARIAQSPSQKQLRLAELYGFKLPGGYTFVRPHERGKGHRDVVYRSRSALRSLYDHFDSDTTCGSQPRWFQFERDVHHMAVKLGFEVEHISANRRGDGGVDLFAHKKEDGADENWIIQCKCWNPGRKVGPSIVRELVGTLANHDVGTRGMIVTTSTFSSAARAEAERARIVLVDNDEFISLMGNQEP